jgi:hypothetical protein
MGEDRERNVYRVIVAVILVLGALGFLWYLTLGGGELGDGGIFGFFSDPAGAPTPTPAE